MYPDPHLEKQLNPDLQNEKNVSGPTALPAAYHNPHVFEVLKMINFYKIIQNQVLDREKDLDLSLWWCSIRSWSAVLLFTNSEILKASRRHFSRAVDPDPHYFPSWIRIPTNILKKAFQSAEFFCGPESLPFQHKSFPFLVSFSLRVERSFLCQNILSFDRWSRSAFYRFLKTGFLVL